MKGIQPQMNADKRRWKARALVIGVHLRSSAAQNDFFRGERPLPDGRGSVLSGL
jgi:hypothetical protein